MAEETGRRMKKKRVTLRWETTFIELCMNRITRTKIRQIDAHCKDVNRLDQSWWYDNTELIKTIFDVDNWWGIDDLDHAMGLVFDDRSALKAKLAAIALDIDGQPANMDPDAPQLSFFAPEAIGPLGEDELIVCHGAHRQTVLRLEVEVERPFDPSLVSLSLLHYPDYGDILIDLDYDGHDDVHYTFGETTYLPPRFFGKDQFDETSR
jgi:hypothetical protein